MTIKVRSERMSDIDELLSVGAGMANTLFNLAHGAELTDDIRQSLTDQRKSWDDARRQYHAAAPPTPVSSSSGSDSQYRDLSAAHFVSKTSVERELNTVRAALKAVIDDLEIRSKNGVVDLSHGVYCTARAALSATAKEGE